MHGMNAVSNAKYRTRNPGPVVQRSCHVLSSALSEKRSI
jgi:hypothetical protein